MACWMEITLGIDNVIILYRGHVHFWSTAILYHWWYLWLCEKIITWLHVMLTVFPTQPHPYLNYPMWGAHVTIDDSPTTWLTPRLHMLFCRSTHENRSPKGSIKHDGRTPWNNASSRLLHTSLWYHSWLATAVSYILLMFIHCMRLFIQWMIIHRS